MKEIFNNLDFIKIKHFFSWEDKAKRIRRQARLRENITKNIYVFKKNKTKTNLLKIYEEL